jgi:hypothetical protein
MSNNNDKKVVMLEVSEKELANSVGQELKSYITELHNKILEEKKEDENKPLTMVQAMDWLGIGRTAFSKIVSKGDVSCILLNPDHKGNKSQKYFFKKDLIAWLKRNRVKTIAELKDLANGE